MYNKTQMAHSHPSCINATLRKEHPRKMKARILVIEDEIAINDLLCMNLEVTGYETVSCLDGNEASDTIRQNHNFQCALWTLCSQAKTATPFCQS